MANYRQAHFVLVWVGRDHVWRELTPEAQARILHEFGQGAMEGKLFTKDFKPV